MKITYDTVKDSISCPELSPEQTQQLQRELSAALLRNDSLQTVAGKIKELAEGLAAKQRG